MRKSVLFRIVVLVLSLSFSSWLAKVLLVKRYSMVASDGAISKAPEGGFNKFIADVQWMLFVHYCGSTCGVSNDNADEIYQRVNAMLRNNPDFTKAYYVGGLVLSAKAPLKAVDILMRGASNKRCASNWNIPFLAGNILLNTVTDKEMPDRLDKAEKMFALAMDRQANLPFLVSGYLRVKAKKLAQGGKWRNGITIRGDGHALLCLCFDEWAKLRGSGEVRHVLNEADLKKRMLNIARRLKARGPHDNDVCRTIEMVVHKVFAGEHLCPICLTPYGPGDKFCSHCGHSVTVYGVCPYCGVVLHGDKYCPQCGRLVEKGQ